MAGNLFGPRQKIEQTNQKAVEDVQAQAAEKLKRVVEGEKTPVRPVTIAPQPNVTLRGDGNIYLAPENKAPEKTTDEIYQEFLQKQSMREFDARHPRVPYREATEYESNSGAGATSEKAASDYQKWSIPLGWNLCLLGIGIFVIVAAVNKLRATSAAFNQFYQAADGQVASWIQSARERAQSTKDPEEMARLNAEIAEMEAARGKLLMKKVHQ